MNEANSLETARTDTGAGMIAWLSVCMLAGAFGHTLDISWQPIWAEAGAFGLTAAVGLGTLERSRSVLDRLASQQRIRLRMEGGLSRLQEQNATLESVSAAIRRVAQHASRQRPGAPAADGDPVQALLHYPCELTPVDVDREQEFLSSTIRIAGRVRQISALSVCLEHDAAFEARLVLLTFELGNDEQLAFVVDIMWTQQADDQFASAGTILAVGTPAGSRLEAVGRE